MKRLAIIAAVVLVVLILAAVAAGHALRRFLTTPQGNATDPPAVLVIERGSSAAMIAAVLDDAAIVRPGWLLERVLAYSGDATRLQAGEYEMPRGLTPLQVIDRLREGRVVTIAITVREGLDMHETAAVFADAGVAPLEDLQRAFADPAPIADLDPKATSLEGYLYPDTYHFPRRADAALIARTLVENFRRRFATPYSGRFDGPGRSLREIVTLASLVEKETALAHERGRVAGVFAERLARGMRLQCDPTVIYAMKLEGRWNGNIRRADLERDHPYNTYRRAGLPPGPIASPGLPALVAALHPQRDGLLFFVAKGDGSHRFSRTLEEHERAVREFVRSRASSKPRTPS